MSDSVLIDYTKIRLSVEMLKVPVAHFREWYSVGRTVAKICPLTVQSDTSREILLIAAPADSAHTTENWLGLNPRLN